MTRFLDMTPTWAGILPALLAILEDGGPEGRDMAREELSRLARAVDSANARAKAEEATALARAQEAAADLKAAHAKGKEEGAAKAAAKAPSLWYVATYGDSCLGGGFSDCLINVTFYDSSLAYGRACREAAALHDAGRAEGPAAALARHEAARAKGGH